MMHVLAGPAAFQLLAPVLSISAHGTGGLNVSSAAIDTAEGLIAVFVTYFAAIGITGGLLALSVFLFVTTGIIGGMLAVFILSGATGRPLASFITVGSTGVLASVLTCVYTKKTVAEARHRSIVAS